MRCCARLPIVNHPDQEKDDKYSDTSTSIFFHIYHIIGRCTTHGRISLNDKKGRKCKQDSASKKCTKVYTIAELVMMHIKIYNFHTSFYITEIQKLAFKIPHVQILSTSYCDDYHQTAFKLRKSFQDMLCCRNYAERLVASFTHKIQSGYYSGNISLSIEGILLEHFS